MALGHFHSKGTKQQIACVELILTLYHGIRALTNPAVNKGNQNHFNSLVIHNYKLNWLLPIHDDHVQFNNLPFFISFSFALSFLCRYLCTEIESFRSHFFFLDRMFFIHSIRWKNVLFTHNYRMYIIKRLQGVGHNYYFGGNFAFFYYASFFFYIKHVSNFLHRCNNHICTYGVVWSRPFILVPSMAFIQCSSLFGHKKLTLLLSVRIWIHTELFSFNGSLMRFTAWERVIRKLSAKVMYYSPEKESKQINIWYLSCISNQQSTTKTNGKSKIAAALSSYYS